MGFLFRALFVVGVIYMLSPLRAELPDWLTRPSPEATRAVMPVLADAAANAVISTCSTHETACANAAKHLAGAVVANNDAQAAFEALVKQATTMPLSQTDSAAPASISALIEKQRPEKSAAPKPNTPNILADAQAPMGLTIIPLPPRRKI